MRLVIPVFVLAMLTIGTIAGWRAESHPTSTRMYILRVSLICCSLNVLLAVVFFSCEASLFGLHRSAAQLAGHDFQTLRLMIRLSSLGVITSILTAAAAVLGFPGIARRWCMGLGIGMGLIWLMVNLGYAEMLAVRTQNL